jgi:hypothetical protein
MQPLWPLAVPVNAYAAYARDLDGNKLAAYCFSPD